MFGRLLSLAGLALLVGCGEPPEPDTPAHGPEPAATPPEPTLRRLTRVQLHHVVIDLFGDDIVAPTSLEPDTAVEGLHAVGAAVTSLSPRGVEQVEDAAYLLAAQVLAPERREATVPCAPSAIVDADCAGAFVATWGPRIWRRPLTSDEEALLIDIAGVAAAELEDFHRGLEFALAAMLQSPHFIYRQELGEPDPDQPGARRYTAFELASRLSFLFWDSCPDDALLQAAADGALHTPEGVEAEAQRLLDDPRARRGLRAFVSEWLHLYELDTMTKDPTVFPHFFSGIGASAREETLLLVEDLVFDQPGDFRQLLTTQTTFLDRNLAMIYGVPAPAKEGFARTQLPADGQRRGFLGQVAFLAPNAHAVSTSATLRGKFVREVLLCQPIPPPPADLDTSIPEPSGDAVTLRDRVADHLDNAYCAGCHRMTDPIGLGVENFDGLGLWRTHEHGQPIDPAGDLDGHRFSDATGLAVAVATHDSFAPCLTETLYGWATGHRPAPGEMDATDWLTEAWSSRDHSLRELLLTLATSRAFRTAGAIEDSRRGARP